jgi:cbb3-type cytochrome oxidase cytochrome c subunit
MMRASQQGPDLIHVASRVDYEWAKRWITDPKAFDPKTKMKMLIPAALTPDHIDNVRMLVWKTSVEAKAAAGGTTAGPTSPASGG